MNNQAPELSVKKEYKQNTGLFKAGNQLYKLRDKDGRSKLFEDPQKFIELCNEYFVESKDRKWIKKDFIKSGQQAGQIVDIEVTAPLTYEGLCNHLGIDVKTFWNYQHNEKYTEYFPIFTYVADIIKRNQFEGAILGIYDSPFIMRYNNMKESIEHSGELSNTITSISFVQRTIEDTEFNEVRRMLDQE